jgi:putative membrane protein
MKVVRILALIAGVVLLGVLIAENDPAAIAASIRELSWRLGILLCFPAGLVMFFDTLGWRYAFTRDRVGFGTLFGARMAGEAFNLTTPTAALGGEAVKTWLLRGHAPADESISSVVIAKTTILIAQGVFLLFGIVLAWWSVRLDSALFQAMLWLLLVESLSLGLFVAAQTRGLFGWGHRILERFALRQRGSGETLRRVDEGLAWFYRREPWRLALSIGFHLVAWVLGALEAYLTLQFLGLDVSLTTATVIEAFGAGIRFATFMIPASLGALEGGYVATFAAFGLGSTSGLAFALTRRLREIVWVAAGLIVFAVMRTGPRSVAQGSPPAGVA